MLGRFSSRLFKVCEDIYKNLFLCYTINHQVKHSTLQKKGLTSYQLSIVTNNYSQTSQML
jgi:hypothetical protein